MNDMVTLIEACSLDPLQALRLPGHVGLRFWGCCSLDPLQAPAYVIYDVFPELCYK